jgi:3D (Asp-Asp-Asp) domain-containing protein
MMRNRSKHFASVYRLKHKIIGGMLLLWVIPCGFIHSGNFNLAAAGAGAHEVCSASAPLQITGRLAAREAQNDPAKQDATWRTVLMRVTGYCPCRKCCGKSSDGITASGHRIRRGDEFVAADKTLSFGTEVIVPGYNNSNPVEVLDRGRAIHGNRLDVFFNSHRKAQAWGVRYLLVKVQKR